MDGDIAPVDALLDLAERHDAVMQLAPPHLHDQTSARLRRIAIRWGLADGVRMTAQFPALRKA